MLTTKLLIIRFLRRKHLAGSPHVMEGVIEEYMRAKNGSKGGTTSRICRFLKEDGILEPVYVRCFKGKKPNVAWKIKDEKGTHG